MLGHGMTKSLVRVAALLAVAGALSACSSVPTWVDPTTWIGGDDNTTATNQNAGDQNTANQDQQANNANNAQYPDLANMPQRPAAPSTPDAQKEVADALVADRNHNQYAGDQLRAGTEAAAAPPSPPSAAPPPEVASTEPTPSSSPSDENQSSDQDNGSIDTTEANAGEPAAGTSAPPPSPPSTPAAAPTGPQTQVASLPPPPASASAPTGEPAVPAVPSIGQGYVPGVQMPQPSDAQLGFKPSSAPPLDASVAQFVATPIINRYRQTATLAGNAAVGPGPAAPQSAIALNAPPGATAPVAGNGAMGEGGPETMSGAVVANLDAIQGGSANPDSVYASASGLPPAEVVMFPNDTTILNTEGLAKVREAFDAYEAQGGRGYIRVVGHSSSRTANMPLKRHLMLNFEKSQARANSVARALIKLGVPAGKVLVEAVGDSQPVYYESMPAGEEGNRRAEIFIQG